VLTADLVNARRRGDQLCVQPLDAAAQLRAQAFAHALIATCAECVGKTRDELLFALASIDVGPREHRLRDALVKLIEDRCEFEIAGDGDPSAVRHDVFSRASAEVSAAAKLLRAVYQSLRASRWDCSEVSSAGLRV